jgi:hypothetical protein
LLAEVYAVSFTHLPITMSYILYGGNTTDVTAEESLFIDNSNHPVFTISTTTGGGDGMETFAFIKADSQEMFCALLLDLQGTTGTTYQLVMVSDPSMIDAVQAIYPDQKVIVPPFFIAARIVDQFNFDDMQIKELARWMEDVFRLEVLGVSPESEDGYANIGDAINAMDRQWPFWSTVGLHTHISRDFINSIWSGEAFLGVQEVLDKCLDL